MLMPKKNRVAIYSYLFREGVVVIKNEPVLTRHPYIAVPNVQVMKALLSLHSRDLVNMQYNWRHFYYTLNDKGIEYLRKYLNITSDTVPNTMANPPAAAPAHPAAADSRGGQGEYRSRRGEGGGFRGRRGGFAGRQ